MSIFPVIMCGGAGTRLWPASRPSRPKQFVSLSGGRSTFQSTMLRMAPLNERGLPIVVCGTRYEDLVQRQLAEIGLNALLLLEPEPRDSGPAMAAAAALIAELDPDGVAAIVASDHHIPDDEAFRAAVVIAAGAAAARWVVTLGIRPASPSTAYGYIDPDDEAALGAVRRVRRFVEKPDAERAARFLADGFLWNSGNFVVGAGAMLDELDRHAPDLAATARAAVAQATRGEDVLRLDPCFCAAPKISIDYALMEKTDRAAVLPVDFVWSDLGAWDAIHAVGERDDADNSVTGDALLIDSTGCFIRNDAGVRLAVVGLRDIAVVAERDALLICDLNASQSVKAAVDGLKAAGAREIDLPPEIDLAGWAERYDVWLRTSALPLWWVLGADHRHGGFHETLDGGGAPVGGPRRARVQTRQTYVFATAAHMGWPGPWRQAAEHGLDFFLRRYARSDGLFATLVSADGATVLDDTPMLYDQAFALLAMAAVVRAWPERRDVSERAEGLLASLSSMRAPTRGFRENGRWPRQANAQMHLLEAALAWFELTGEAAWGGLADELAELALDAFIDSRGLFLREVFDEAWRPAAGDDGRFIEPGHQFEWAWLLTTWARLRPGRDVAAVVDGLMKAGARGVDARRGVAVDELWDDLSMRSDRARLWPQTERLRASLACLDRAGAESGARRTRAATEAASALWRYLETPVPGLWRDKQDAAGDFLEEPAPASSLYHILGAVMALKAMVL
ncbi:MAG: AGE family epimerase/isomerase [Caulobacter sp.]